jgi:hypothetical protein
MAMALARDDVNPARIVAAFERYMREGGHRVTSEQFAENLAAKLDLISNERQPGSSGESGWGIK